MKEFMTDLFSGTPLFSGSKEGLPYWIFWFLLCIILLLLIFIFLRDKDLRQRLNGFFFGIKKKLKKSRLQARLKMIRRRKAALFTELGQKAWEKGLMTGHSDPDLDTLADLEQTKKELHVELKKAESAIVDLKAALSQVNSKFNQDNKALLDSKKNDDIRVTTIRAEEKTIEKEVAQRQSELEGTTRSINAAKKEQHDLEVHSSLSETDKSSRAATLKETIESLAGQQDDLDAKIHRLVEEKAEKRTEKKNIQKSLYEHNQRLKSLEDSHKKEVSDFQHEIKDWSKTKQKALEKLNKIEAQKFKLYGTVGHLVDSERPGDRDLAVIYSKIDRRKNRIKEIQKQIQELD